MEKRIEKLIEKAKALAEANGDIRFVIPDNCPGDGWDGTLTKDGCYMLGNNHFEGELFGWDTAELQLWIEDIIDACECALEKEDKL